MPGILLSPSRCCCGSTPCSCDDLPLEIRITDPDGTYTLSRVPDAEFGYTNDWISAEDPTRHKIVTGVKITSPGPLCDIEPNLETTFDYVEINIPMQYFIHCDLPNTLTIGRSWDVIAWFPDPHYFTADDDCDLDAMFLSYSGDSSHGTLVFTCPLETQVVTLTQVGDPDELPDPVGDMDVTIEFGPF